jgi:hypothetical protein
MQSVEASTILSFHLWYVVDLAFSVPMLCKFKKYNINYMILKVKKMLIASVITLI